MKILEERRGIEGPLAPVSCVPRHVPSLEGVSYTELASNLIITNTHLCTVVT